jgi:hypothetical protein
MDNKDVCNLRKAGILNSSLLGSEELELWSKGGVPCLRASLLTVKEVELQIFNFTTTLNDECNMIYYN